MKTFKWLLKRELWEHKGGFVYMPVIVGGIMTVVIAISLLIAVFGIKDGMKINDVSVSCLTNLVSPAQKAEFAERLVSGYAGFAMPILLALCVCIFFFCLGALFDERRDRSVLFWKSLPLSDGATVLSKVAMALGIAPVIAVVVSTLTAILAGILICIGAAAAGVNIFGEILGNPGTYLAPVQMAALLPIYALWALPTIGWLLMVSAWSRSKPFLWAIGAPVLVGTLLSWINTMFQFSWDMGWFWRNIVGRLLASVVPGSWLGQGSRTLPSGDITASDNAMSDLLLNSWQILSGANVWIGVALGVGMIYAAIRLRGWRDEG